MARTTRSARAAPVLCVGIAIPRGLAGCGEPAGGATSPADGGPYRYAEGVNTGDPMYVKCWVQVRYDGPHDPAFSTNVYDQIRGPAEVHFLRDLGDRLNHADWTGRVTNVSTGPTARLTLYEGEGLTGRSATIEPSTGDTPVVELGVGGVGSMRIEFVER